MNEPIYLICPNDNISNSIIDQVRAENYNNWISVHYHPTNGSVAVSLPGYDQYTKFGLTTLTGTGSLASAGYN